MKEAAGTLIIAKSTARVLLGLRSRNKGGYGCEKWSLWGGSLNQNETPISGVVREVKEETGIKLTSWKLHPWDVWTNHQGTFCYYTFVSVFEEEFTPCLNHEHSGYGWFEVDSLPYPLHIGVKHCFLNKKAQSRLLNCLK